MKRYIVFYLLIFIFNNAVAQSEFKDAYILVSENDTIFGQIDNKSYLQNSLYCDFRVNENDSVQRYYPKDLFAYRFINGKYYISKNIEEETIDTSYFFEYLINGELDIYFLQKAERNMYYVSDDGIILNKLKKHKKIIYKDEKRMLLESNQYIGLLDYYTADYPVLKSDIRNITVLNHKNLIKLGEKYHDLACEGEQCMIYEKKISKKLILEVSPAYNFVINQKLISTETRYPSYEANFLFQISQNSERFYFGIGYVHDKILLKDYYIVRIPLSFNYIHPKNGLSPLFSYTFDIPYLSLIQTISAGAQFKIKNTAFFIKGNIHTYGIIKPFSSSLGIGLRFDLRE